MRSLQISAVAQLVVRGDSKIYKPGDGICLMLETMRG